MPKGGSIKTYSLPHQQPLRRDLHLETCVGLDARSGAKVQREPSSFVDTWTSGCRRERQCEDYEKTAITAGLRRTRSERGWLYRGGGDECANVRALILSQSVWVQQRFLRPRRIVPVLRCFRTPRATGADPEPNVIRSADPDWIATIPETRLSGPAPR